MAPPPAPAPRPKPSITDMMKNPGKVVMMMNMVGPGEVDAELEPEVKEECETKYGDIVKVKCSDHFKTIFCTNFLKVQIVERGGVAAEEAVRIFLEFKRVESAIKGIVGIGWNKKSKESSRQSKVLLVLGGIKNHKSQVGFG